MIWRNEADGLRMYDVICLSDVASLEAYAMISLVVGSSHETTPIERMIRKHFNRQQMKLTKTTMIDAYNTLHDELLACGITLQDIKFHERLTKNLETNRPVTASSSIDGYK